MKVLITAGGTAEPIDGVRRITNTSTGATGGVIARTFQSHGHEVVLIHAEEMSPVGFEAEGETFVTFADLGEILERRLGEERYDAVIHLAAVSDYSVAQVEIDGRPIEIDGGGKIASGHDVLIRLAPNPKLLDQLRSWSLSGSIQVVGFKLTHEATAADRASKVRALLDRGTTDLVVHNDQSEINATAHPAEVWTPKGPIVQTGTKHELAEALVVLLNKIPPNPTQRHPETHP